MTKDEALKLALETLEANRQTHRYCEDTWYSCPKHEEGCANEFEGDECNCGADKANFQIDYAITAIKETLAQPEQEPVAWYVERQHVGFRDHGVKLGPFWKRADAEEWVDDKQILKPLYTTPPQRKPLTDEEIDELRSGYQSGRIGSFVSLARAIEAAHGIGCETTLVKGEA